MTEPIRLFDVHTHLHDPRIIGDTRGILSRAEAAGVAGMVTCATMEANFSATLGLAEENPPVFPCLGIHPWFLDTLGQDWEQNLGEHLSSTRAGVGETGLDHMDRSADRELQKQVFKTHLGLARELNRPVNIHIRKAWDDLIHILKQMGPFPAGGVVHSFSGSPDLVRVLVSHNLYISFSGALTRPNAKKAVKSLCATPLDRILFETDTPDLFPSLEGGAGKESLPLNEPMFVRDILRIASGLRGIEFEKLASHGYSNALELFGPLMGH